MAQDLRPSARCVNSSANEAAMAPRSRNGIERASSNALTCFSSYALVVVDQQVRQPVECRCKLQVAAMQHEIAATVE